MPITILRQRHNVRLEPMEKESEIDVVSRIWTVWDHKYLVIAISLIFGVIAA